MKFWIFDDAHHWADALTAKAEARGHECFRFNHARQPILGGVVFMHMQQHPSVRDHHKRIMQHLATKPEFCLIPSYREAMLYDDKLEQLRVMAQFMPKTHVIRTPAQANEFMSSGFSLPIISKNPAGSGARPLRALLDMRQEVKMAFSDLGLRNRHGDRSHGVLYWQESLGELPYDYRVLIVGHERLIVRRMTRNGTPSRRELQCVTETNSEIDSLLGFVTYVTQAFNLKFCALDIAQSEGKWYILKLNVSWDVRDIADCVWLGTGRKGTEIWDVLLDQVESGGVRCH